MSPACSVGLEARMFRLRRPGALARPADWGQAYFAWISSEMFCGTAS
jgi:hypothetical protein